MNSNPLSGLKIIEIASVLAGPSVGMFFAENGSHVLKIENKKTGGDVTRSWKLPTEQSQNKTSAYFSSVNYKKNYLSADFTNLVDLQKVVSEIRTADILIANFKAGDAKKFGLNYETLKAENPKLIYGEISGFGEENDRVAYDLILQAESGFMYMNGTEDSGPVKMPVALIDLLAGHQLKEGILVALLQRQTTQRGCRVHVSLFDSAIASLANQATNWLMANKNAERMGSKHPNIAPYGETFKTADNRLITFAIGSDVQFQKLCSILNLTQLTTDINFSSNQNRVQNRAALEKMIAEKIVMLNSDELVKKLHAVFVPVAIIRSISEVFQNEDASKLIREELIEGEPTRRVTSCVYKITD